MSIEELFPLQNRYGRFLVGLYLSRRRGERHLSVEELAQLLSMSPLTYRRIESGRSKISPQNFDTLTEVLDLDMDDLIELSRIARIKHINDISKSLSLNYPQ
ncbi:MAG: helix-turn-helix transcriptional regulator [Bdellovibrio sp.]